MSSILLIEQGNEYMLHANGVATHALHSSENVQSRSFWQKKRRSRLRISSLMALMLKGGRRALTALRKLSLNNRRALVAIHVVCWENCYKTIPLGHLNFLDHTLRTPLPEKHGT